MARTKHSQSKGGRLTKENSLALRGDALEMLLDKWRSDDIEPLLKYKDAEKALHVDRKTARSVLRDIADISADIVIVSDGIRVGRDTYYHKHARIAREAKDKMANKFASLIPPNVTLACSPGTTVSYCVRRLIEERQYHVIVTNNIGVLDMLARSDIANLVFTGGEYVSAIHACVGNDAVEAFNRAKCQAALIGVSGISESGELFVRHSPEVGVLYQIVQSVTHLIYIVADLRKFLQPDTWRFARIPQLCTEKLNLEIYLITCPDKSLNKDELAHVTKVVKALQKMGVKVEWA
ncbi:MAG: DeoR/GlpR family DNA-binding transcription regulator [Planctomycetota bacterium]|jgi:DeoR/GlpR family transcriptional regulator of sugar metabolism